MHGAGGNKNLGNFSFSNSLSDFQHLDNKIESQNLQRKNKKAAKKGGIVTNVKMLHHRKAKRYN